MRANALMSSSFPLYGYLYWGKAGITPFKGKKKKQGSLGRKTKPPSRGRNTNFSLLTARSTFST